jgi:hypothetical protein
LGNWGLVDEGFAQRLGPGIYRLTDFGHKEAQKALFVPFSGY